MILINKVSADTVSDIVTSLGGFINILIRSGGDTTPVLGGGTVTIEISSPNDGLNRFRPIENAVFTTDDTKSGIFISQGLQLRATLDGSSGAVDVTVEIIGVE